MRNGQIRNVVIVDGLRSPFARGGRGKLVATRLDETGAQVLRALLDRNPKVPDTMIEDVGLGNVTGRGEFVLLGTVQRLAGLPLEACAFNSNRQCGSSMETFQRIAMSIALGAIDCGVALGIERMGRALGGGGGGEQTRVNRMNPRLLEMTAAQKKMAPDHDQYFSVPFPDYILQSPPLQGMPQTAQNVAEVYGLAREALDRFALESHQKTHAAYEAGVYKDEVLPLEVEDPVFDDQGSWVEAETGPTVVFDRDEGIRPSTSLDKLAGLPGLRGLVSFGEKEIVITAGNPSGIAATARLTAVRSI